MWSQLRVFHWGGIRSQREEGEASQNPPGVTGTKGEGDLEVIDGPGQEPGAVGIWATSDPSVAPLCLGEAERGIAGTRGADDAASGARAAVPGVLPRAAPGRVEPGRGENLLGGPEPH